MSLALRRRVAFPLSRVSALSRFSRICWSFAAMSRHAVRLIGVTRGHGREGHSLPARNGSGAHGASDRAVLSAPSLSLALAPFLCQRAPAWVDLAEGGRLSHRPRSQVLPPGSRLSHPFQSACLSSHALGVRGVCARCSCSFPAHASRYAH